MKLNLALTTVALLTGSLMAADSGGADAVKASAKKLGEASNYSWKTTTEAGANSRFTPGPQEGKTGNGVIMLTMSMGDNKMEAVVKGEKGAIKTEEGWKSFAEAAGDGGGGGGGGNFNPARFAARMLRSFKAPAVQSAELAEKSKSLAKAEDVYSGDLTEEGVKDLMTRGFRRGGNAPDISGAKGSVKFWVKDGVLTKYQFNVQGTIAGPNGDFQIDRTTTVEIKDVGSTKVEVPADAEKKLS